MRDFFEMVIVPTAFIFFVVFILILPVLASSRYECLNSYKSINTEWSYTSGCSVEYEPGKWIPSDKYSVNIEVEK